MPKLLLLRNRDHLQSCVGLRRDAEVSLLIRTVVEAQEAVFELRLGPQTFIVHLLRTEKIPFLESRAAWPLMLSSFGTMAFGVAICYIPGLNAAVGLSPVISSFYAYLIGTILAYCVAVQVYKRGYINTFQSWL